MRPWLKYTSFFCLGLFSGILGTGLVVRNCYEPPAPTHPSAVLERLSTKLDLSPDQREKVADLLKKELSKGEALRKETHLKFKVLRTSFDNQMKLHLNPEQQKKLELMEAQWEGRQAPRARFFSYRWSFRAGGHPSASCTVTIK